MAPAAKSGSAELKKKIRDTERLLRRENLLATIRVEQERKLKALKAALEDAGKEKRAQEISSRYKMVMFFETKKIQRLIKQQERRMGASDSPEEREKLGELRQKLSYIQNYPKGKKYVSLFPGGKLSSDLPPAAPSQPPLPVSSQEKNCPTPTTSRARKGSPPRRQMAPMQDSKAPSKATGNNVSKQQQPASASKNLPAKGKDSQKKQSSKKKQSGSESEDDEDAEEYSSDDALEEDDQSGEDFDSEDDSDLSEDEEDGTEEDADSDEEEYSEDDEDEVEEEEEDEEEDSPPKKKK